MLNKAITTLHNAYLWLANVERETVAKITNDFHFLAARLDLAAEKAKAEVENAEAEVQKLLSKQVYLNAEHAAAAAISAKIKALVTP